MVQRVRSPKIYKKSKGRGFVFVFKIGGFAILFLLSIVFVVFIFFAKDLPRPEKFTEKQFIQSTKIYDRTGEVLLYEIYGEEKRTIVPLETIPKYLQEAVIATEDADFYHHFGVDFRGIIRSVLINFRIMEPVYGGSTIPQQLIRSTFFSNEKTIKRKTREIILSLELDRRYSKEEILEWYLNQIPFGSNCYGAEAASQTFFGKPVSEISIAESAALAALVQAPSYLSPYGPNKAELLVRKDYVLDRMVKEQYLTTEKAEEAKREEIEFIEKPIQIKAPYFTLWVKQNLIDEYGEDFLRREGLKVHTTLDWELQEKAERIVAEGVEQNKIYNAYNAGLVAINPDTGEILAMTVGTGDYYSPSFPEDCTAGVDCLFDPKFNVVVGTKNNPGRQPGSSFKPFVYVTAFTEGYTATTTVLDEETNFGIWGDEEYIPQNYTGRFYGLVTLRKALAQSLNVSSIKVLYLAGLEEKIESLEINDFSGLENVFVNGLEKSIETAKDLGITTLNNPLSSYGPALVLGGGEVKLLEMASAYGVFATEGLRVKTLGILKIEDQKGNIIKENKNNPLRVLGREPTRLINDILSDNESRAPMFGLNSALYFQDYEVAAKTGTTQDSKDAWVVGYSPSVVVGVWVGNNNNESMAKQPAVVIAGPIFHRFMEEVLIKYPKESFNKPTL